MRPLLPGGQARPVNADGEMRFAPTELIAGHSHGQRFVCECDGLCGIDILIATFARLNTGRLDLYLRSNPGAEGVIAEAHVPAVRLADGAFYRFGFEPIRDSAGRLFYMFAESANSVPGDAVTIWARAPRPGKPSGRYEDGMPARGDLVYRLVYTE